MTNQQILQHFGELNAAEMRLARAIVGWHERQIEELKAEVHKWKANHDNQVKLKSLLINRPDLGDRAPRIQKMLDENAKIHTTIVEGCRKVGIAADDNDLSTALVTKLVERIEDEARLSRAVVKWQDRETLHTLRHWSAMEKAVEKVCIEAGLDVKSNPDLSIDEMAEMLTQHNAKLRAAADGLAEKVKKIAQWRSVCDEYDKAKGDPQRDYGETQIACIEAVAARALASYQATKP